MEPNLPPQKTNLDIKSLLKDRKKALIYLFPVFSVVVLIAVLLVVTRGGKESVKDIVTNTKKEVSTVAPKTEYDNPFDKDSQYVNPFSSYKNPFDNLK